MSGALDGLARVLAGREDTGSGYEPGGEPPAGLKAIDALMEFYVGERWQGIFLGTQRSGVSNLLLDLMPSAREKDFDANEFLFWFIPRWAPEVDASDPYWETYLTEVVQALYDAGHNDLVIDCSPLPSPMVFGFLMGEPERHLKIAYHVQPVAELGQRPNVMNLHMSLAVVTGECMHGGTNSSGSALIFRDDVALVGAAAYGCVFHLRSFGQLSAYAEDCSFYLWGEVPGEERLKELHKQGFFENNRLFACHADGTHEQIVPCQQRSWLRSRLNRYTFRREDCERPIPWEEYV